MIDYLDGYILIAYRNTIIYIDVSSLGIQEKKLRITEDKQHYIEVPITDEQLFELDLNQNYKIISILEIGNSMSAVVIEDLISRQIRFLRCAYYPVDGKKRLKLVQLGLQLNKTMTRPSKLLKLRSVSKVDPKTKKTYQVSVAVRENGRFEVYSDFMLVHEYYDPKLQCVDIETDFNQFYLKFVKNADQVANDSNLEDLEYEIR